VKKSIIYGVGGIAIAVSVAVLVSRYRHPADPPSEAQPAEVTVKLGKIEHASLCAYVTGFGTVEPQPATNGQQPASAKVATPVAGLLAESHTFEGAVVQRGATLFQLDSRVADVQVEKSRQAVEFADVAFERQKRLLSVDGTSKKLYQEAEQQLQAARYELANATAQRALLTIKAPIAGTVIRVAAKPGDAVDPSAALAEIVDLKRLVVTAKIRTTDVNSLRLRQSVELSPGRPEAPEQAGNVPLRVRASISYIGDQVDPSSDTVIVRAALPSNSGLRPGQFVTLRVLVSEHPNSLAVPQDSVISDPGRGDAWVMVVDNGTAFRHSVKTGIKDKGLVEIQGDGLHEGTVIVATGAYGLVDRTRVRQAAQ
jgi:membrane fusion protein (multidrug efflux system)